MSLKVTIKSDTNWGGAGNGTIVIVNEGNTSIDNWSANIKIDGDLNIQECWNVSFTKTSNIFSFSGKDWNKNISAKQEITSGFSYNGTGVFTQSSIHTPQSTQPTKPQTPQQPQQPQQPQSQPKPPSTSVSGCKYSIDIVKTDYNLKTASLMITNVSDSTCLLYTSDAADE
jgi:hypothetical protein